MTGSKTFWWKHKSVETVLTAAVLLWIGALVVDVVLSANTPVRGLLIGSVLTGAIVATAMFFSQLRKRKAPAKPQVEMPPWVPPMQTWYMAGIFLLLAYLQVVTFGNAAGATWASTWLNLAAPFSDLASRVVPVLDAYSESLVTHGYEDRVPIARHAQAVSWVWLFLVNSYLIIWFILRWSFIKSHVKTQSIFKSIFATFILFLIFIFFYVVSTYAYISYENKPHSLFNLVHYIDSSLILNSVFFPLMLYAFFMLFLSVLILIPALISNIFTHQE